MQQIYDAINELNSDIEQEKQAIRRMLSQDSDMIFNFGVSVKLAELHGTISVSESDAYSSLQEWLTEAESCGVSASSSGLDLLSDEMVDEFNRAIHELACEAQSAWKRGLELDSDYAAFESAYEFSRANTAYIFLSNLEGLTEECDREISETYEYME